MMRICKIPPHVAAMAAGFVMACWLLRIDAAGATEQNPGSWNVISTTGAFQDDGADTPWRYSLDAQARYFDIGSGSNQWLARPAIGYTIREGVNVWLGYARFRARAGSGAVADENRVWQQVNWNAGALHGGQVSMRVRLEQRSLSTGDDVGLVMRYRAQYVRPLNDAAGTQLIVGLEPFFDLRDTDWGANAGLSQNRVYVLVGRPLGDRISLDAGYMNQFFWREQREDTSNHHLVLSVKFKL